MAWYLFGEILLKVSETFIIKIYDGKIFCKQRTVQLIVASGKMNARWKTVKSSKKRNRLKC